MKKLLAIAIAGLLCLVFTGCPIGPGSRLYKPVSDWEEYAVKKADRQKYPNDVREDFSSHDSSRVAWPGIVLSAAPIVSDSAIEVRFVIEHHYYDWIEDFSIQQERIFLTPRGEGVFETSWYIKADADTTDIKESIGDMIIVYGIPTGVRDSLVDLRAFYIRTIDPAWFATDILDYGRPGEPAEILRIPQ
ncbi:MAG: hypothetical protein KKA42_05140 [candidate division Zixibacteria bacterium]|nr:hypothetical protein [candidate division Zixibacteria bacterium]